MHHGNSSVKGRSCGPSIAVVSRSSNSDLFSSSNVESGELSHGYGAGLDVDIARAKVAKILALSVSGSRADFNSVITDGSTTVVSGTSPGDLDRALNSLHAHGRRRRLGSESDF